MEHLFTEILNTIGEDTEREGLINTPKRAANALRFLTKGYTPEKITEIIKNTVRIIPQSTCGFLPPSLIKLFLNNFILFDA